MWCLCLHTWQCWLIIEVSHRLNVYLPHISIQNIPVCTPVYKIVDTQSKRHNFCTCYVVLCVWMYSPWKFEQYLIPVFVSTITSVFYLANKKTCLTEMCIYIRIYIMKCLVWRKKPQELCSCDTLKLVQLIYLLMQQWKMSDQRERLVNHSAFKMLLMNKIKHS